MLLVRQSLHQYTPLKLTYTFKKNQKNAFLTITSFIHSQNSMYITCSETNNALISIYELFGIYSFIKSKNLDINSFTKFRDDYSSYMYGTYNNKCEFIKINYGSNLLDAFSLHINTASITTPQNT